MTVTAAGRSCYQKTQTPTRSCVMDVGAMDAFGRTHRYRDRRCQAGRVHEKEFCISSCSSLTALRNPWFCYVRNSSTILYRMAFPATENRSVGIYLNTPWQPIRLSLLRLSEVVGQLKDLSLRLRMGVTIDDLLNSVGFENDRCVLHPTSSTL